MGGTWLILAEGTERSYWCGMWDAVGCGPERTFIVSTSGRYQSCIFPFCWFVDLLLYFFFIACSEKSWNLQSGFGGTWTSAVNWGHAQKRPAGPPPCSHLCRCRQTILASPSRSLLVHIYTFQNVYCHFWTCATWYYLSKKKVKRKRALQSYWVRALCSFPPWLWFPIREESGSFFHPKDKFLYILWWGVRKTSYPE